MAQERAGKKWTNDEEKSLLQELDKNIDINTISEIHGRTLGGINFRRREIAYKMYIEGIDMEEIIQRTKLDNSQITETISRREIMGQKWTTDEIQHLLKQIEDSGLGWKDIAQNHNRSISSVQTKAIYEYLKDENYKDESTLSKKLKVPIEMITEIVQKKQNRATKQESRKEKKENPTPTHAKYESKSLGILWDFKIYLLSKYEFDDSIHTVFDDFVKEEKIK